MDAALSATMTMAQAKPPAAAPAPTANVAKAAWAAKEYESVFVSEFLGSMFSGISTDGITGGGQGEAMFRSLLIDQYAKQFEQQGGFGLAAHMQAELLKHQQVGP
jgi:Rod binding domain-containing protein